jgi:hypothetical protein
MLDSTFILISSYFVIKKTFILIEVIPAIKRGFLFIRNNFFYFNNNIAATAANANPTIFENGSPPFNIAWYVAGIVICATIIKTINVPTACGVAFASILLNTSKAIAPTIPAPIAHGKLLTVILCRLPSDTTNTHTSTTEAKTTVERLPLKPLLFISSGQIPNRIPAITAFTSRLSN